MSYKFQTEKEVPRAVRFINITFTLKKEVPKLFYETVNTLRFYLCWKQRGWTLKGAGQGSALGDSSQGGRWALSVPGSKGPEEDDARAGGSELGAPFKGRGQISNFSP